jgi:hypothetical protein
LRARFIFMRLMPLPAGGLRGLAGLKITFSIAERLTLRLSPQVFQHQVSENSAQIGA